MSAEKSLEITSDLFTQVGLTPAESAGLVVDNSSPVRGGQPLLEPVPGAASYRIRDVVGVDDVSTMFVFDPEPQPVSRLAFARAAK